MLSKTGMFSLSDNRKTLFSAILRTVFGIFLILSGGPSLTIEELASYLGYFLILEGVIHLVKKRIPFAGMIMGIACALLVIFIAKCELKTIVACMAVFFILTGGIIFLRSAKINRRIPGYVAGAFLVIMGILLFIFLPVLGLIGFTGLCGIIFLLSGILMVYGAWPARS